MAGVGEDGVQEGDEAGDLVGLAVYLVLSQDDAGGDVVGGQQVRAGAVGAGGAADGLAVDGDVPPVQPPGGGLGAQPGAQLLIGRGGISSADGPLDRLEARRHVPAQPLAVPDPAAAQRLLRHRLRELRGGVHRVRARQPGDHDHRQDRRQMVPHPLRLAVVGDLAQVVQQPAVPLDPQRVEVRGAPPGQRRRVEPRRQGCRPARDQLIQPAVLRPPVVKVMRAAAAAPEPGGLPHGGEPARLVRRPGVSRRVGERLRHDQPHPERRQVIGGQPAQHRRQRPRRRVRHPRRGRQHAQPLVRAHPLQPRRPLLVAPPQVRVPDRDPPRRRPERAQHHRRPIGFSHVPQHPARRRRAQAVMLSHQLVVPPGLRPGDKTDLQLNALISHPAGISQAKRPVHPAVSMQLTRHQILL